MLVNNLYDYLITAHLTIGYLVTYHKQYRVLHMAVKLKIRELRLNHPNKPTQRYMGDLLGMTESNYRKLESNVLESVKFDHLNRLVKFFNCKIEEMVEYVND